MVLDPLTHAGATHIADCDGNRAIGNEMILLFIFGSPMCEMIVLLCNIMSPMCIHELRLDLVDVVLAYFNLLLCLLELVCPLHLYLVQTGSASESWVFLLLRTRTNPLVSSLPSPWRSQT